MAKLEGELADSFRRAGFKDAWMAEDISLTVEEKIRIDGPMLMSREDIDSLVISLLNAAGFQDVAREYAASKGNDPFMEERRNLKHWTDSSVGRLLMRSMPLNAVQTESLAAKCCDVLRNCGLELATDKFIIGLALHLYLNDIKDLGGHVQENVLNSNGTAPKGSEAISVVLSPLAIELDGQGICRIMPFSSVFPKVRVCVNLGKVRDIMAGGWVSEISLAAPLEKIAPVIIEMLSIARKELGERFPRLAEMPSSIVLTGIQQDEAERLALPMLKNALTGKLDFPCIFIVH